MSRVTNAIMGKAAYAATANAPVLNLEYGGQFGYAPNLKEWVSNAAYLRRNLIPILIEAPRFFQYLPARDRWIASLKALVELHPLSIDGLQGGLEVATTEHPVGGGGQMQREFTNVTEIPSNVTFNWNEKYGMPISRFLDAWIRLGMMDPNSKVAGVATLASQRPTDMLPDMYAMTMAFIEPDPQHVKVQQAWLVTNLFPTNIGDIIGRRELTAGSDLTPINVQFGGIAQRSEGVTAFCQTLLDSIDITNALPSNRAAFVNKIDADVLAGRSGYANSARETGREAVGRGIGGT